MKKKINYGRKRVIRALPPLTETCSTFDAFQGDERRKERIFAMLQTVIQGSRRSTPQPFYSMRDVASFFGVSVCTVSKVYRRLQNEGLLTLVRGSQTAIPARIPRPRIAVRGVVAMPIWMPGFLQFLDWRRFFSQLEEELSRQRFILQPIFFRQGEDENPDFVDRVLKFNPDYLLWNSPAATDCSVLQSIDDAGVPLLVINSSPHAFPGRIYRTSYERALRQGLEEWKSSGEVDRIIIPQTKPGNLHATHIIGPILRDCALPQRFTYCDLADPGLVNYLRRLAPSPRTGVIFDDDLLYTWLCIQAPALMYRLFRRHRVMVGRQATIPSMLMPTGVTVDAILPNRRLARQIATDLNKGLGQLPSEGLVFESEWRSRISLADVVQFHFGE